MDDGGVAVAAAAEDGAAEYGGLNRKGRHCWVPGKKVKVQNGAWTLQNNSRF
jgi:hypothetical protein